jgi:hypothetical protein
MALPRAWVPARLPRGLPPVPSPPRPAHLLAAAASGALLSVAERWQVMADKFSYLYFEAPLNQEQALVTALDQQHAFKKAKVRQLGKHEPESPRRHFLSGYVNFGNGTTLTRPVLTELLPQNVTFDRKPLNFNPPAGQPWSAQHQYELVRRGDQTIMEYSQLGTNGPNYADGNSMLIDEGKPHQGKRSDVDEMIDAARGGMKYDELCEVFLKHADSKTMKAARRAYLNKQTRTSCEVIVRYGSTGTGKTHCAIHEDWPDEPFFDKICEKDNKWWCNYDGERKVILNEFRGAEHGSGFAISRVNQWMEDHNLCRVEPKFGSCKLLADKFVLTSPKHPVEWYPDNNAGTDNVDQLLRRISAIYHHTLTQPALGNVFTTKQVQGRNVYLIETRRQPGESTEAWCARVRATAPATA